MHERRPRVMSKPSDEPRKGIRLYHHTLDPKDASKIIEKETGPLNWGVVKFPTGDRPGGPRASVAEVYVDDATGKLVIHCDRASPVLIDWRASNVLTISFQHETEYAGPVNR
jgi:hypothetical protein